MNNKPYVWQMIKEAVENLGGKGSYSEIKDYIWKKYGEVNESTINCQIIVCTVNHPSRIHYPENKKPRVADSRNSRYDFLFSRERGRVEVYDPKEHGVWEIRKNEYGKLIVDQIESDEFPVVDVTRDIIEEEKELFPAESHLRISILQNIGTIKVNDYSLLDNLSIPNREEFLKGCEEFEKHEKRDAMYKVATFLVSHFWGKPSDTADGLGVLLLTWNQAFYRYGIFDFDKLEKCISDNFQKIENFRSRDIFSLSSSDEDNIKHLFNKFLEALQIDSGKMQGRKSPVAVAKTLHLLAPNFFPLWDDKIARAYGCYYNENPAGKYVLFCKITKTIVDKVKDYVVRSDKTITKLIDEYNYSKYTQRWI